MSSRIKITADNKTKRIKHREATMTIGDQLEAILDEFRRLKAEGQTLGPRMERILGEDDKIRGKYDNRER